MKVSHIAPDCQTAGVGLFFANLPERDLRPASAQSVLGGTIEMNGFAYKSERAIRPRSLGQVETNSPVFAVTAAEVTVSPADWRHFILPAARASRTWQEKQPHPQRSLASGLHPSPRTSRMIRAGCSWRRSHVLSGRIGNGCRDGRAPRYADIPRWVRQQLRHSSVFGRSGSCCPTVMRSVSFPRSRLPCFSSYGSAAASDWLGCQLRHLLFSPHTSPLSTSPLYSRSFKAMFG
jgi:hypothetical protein